MPSDAVRAPVSRDGLLDLGPLFRALDRHGVAHAVLRNYETLPRALPGSDLDILIGRGCGAGFDAALADFVAGRGVIFGGFRSGAFRKRALILRSGPDAWHGLAIDAFEEIRFRGAALLLAPAPEALSLAHPRGFRALEPGIAATLAILKDLLHGRDLPQRHLAAAREAFLGRRDALALAFEPIGTRAFAILARICLLSPTGAALAHERRRLRRAVMGRSFRMDPAGHVRRRLCHQASRLRRIAAPPGLALAFIGPDGAGKSTLIAAIEPVLSEATHGAIECRHLRPGLLPALGRFRRAGKSGDTADPHGTRPGGLLGSLLRLGWLAADYLLGHWLIVRPRLARGPAFVVFDRYAHDLVLDPRRLCIALPAWLRAWTFACLPRPDLTIAVVADPSSILARKPELPGGEVRRQVAEIARLAATDPDIRLVATDADPAASRDAVLAALLDRLATTGTGRSP
jgi:thymidylate kinase